MTTFMLYFFAFNLRFAPHPQAGSKSRVICFWSATSFRLRSASETVERLTIEIVGFIAYLLLSGFVERSGGTICHPLLPSQTFARQPWGQKTRRRHSHLFPKDANLAALVDGR